jgi:hypothetical protein
VPISAIATGVPRPDRDGERCENCTCMSASLARLLIFPARERATSRLLGPCESRHQSR